jgi:hypothetical protein
MSYISNLHTYKTILHNLDIIDVCNDVASVEMCQTNFNRKHKHCITGKRAVARNLQVLCFMQ